MMPFVKSSHRVFALGIFLFLCAACSPGPTLQSEQIWQSKPPATPAQWRSSVSKTESSDTQSSNTTPTNGEVTIEPIPVNNINSWLLDFEDENLIAVVQQALANNLDLNASAIRLQSAYAQTLANNAARKLKLNHSLDGSRSRRNLVIGQDIDRDYSNSFGFGFDLSWELDLWRKLKSSQQASLLNYQSAHQLHHHAQLSLAANVAKTWYGVTEAQLQQRLIQQRIINLTDNLEALEDGYLAGLNDALDIYLARADLQREHARLANQQISLQQQKRNLELLINHYPGAELESAATLPTPNTAIPVGLPSQLISRRPDIIAAQLDLEASELNAKVAHLDRFPALRLTGNLGTRSEELEDLLSGDFIVSSLFASVVTPLLDGGKLKAAEQIAYNAVQEAEIFYQNTVLNAFKEVESALSNERLLQQQYQATKQSALQFTQAEVLAFERYQAGLVNYITVLESQRRAFDALSSEIQLRNIIIQNRIDLYLALGGGFSEPNTHTP